MYCQVSGKNRLRIWGLGVRLLSGAPTFFRTSRAPQRTRRVPSGSALGRRRADRTFDRGDQRVEPDRLRYAAVALAPVIRQFRQVAAHDERLRAEIGGAIGNDRAVAIRQPP